jgi:hypothetical protein
MNRILWKIFGSQIFGRQFFGSQFFGSPVFRKSIFRKSIFQKSVFTRQDMTRHDTTRHDTTRHDTTRHEEVNFSEGHFWKLIFRSKICSSHNGASPTSGNEDGLRRIICRAPERVLYDITNAHSPASSSCSPEPQPES